MPDFRSFARVEEITPSEIVLSPEESHHLVRVNRARAGDQVIVFDGRGNEWVCECVEPDRRATRLRVKGHHETPRLEFRITLAQALPKGKTFDSIIRKSTEIGAARIVPLVTSRTEVRLDASRKEAKQEKWMTTAIEGAKQSGNSFLPEIDPLQSIEDFLPQTAAYDLKLVASLEPGAESLRTILERFAADKESLPQNAVWLVGPEGDFSPEEYQAAKAAGFSPVSLGPLVLRCDTAAIYALSILSYELLSP